MALLEKRIPGGDGKCRGSALGRDAVSLEWCWSAGRRGDERSYGHLRRATFLVQRADLEGWKQGGSMV